MASNHETFWLFNTFAVVGHSAKKPFPKLTYNGLKKLGKTVYPVDPSAKEIEGDQVYTDLASLPSAVEAVVLELPKEETETWVERVVQSDIKELWIHMNTETPQAVAIAEKNGINLRTGTCGVMYVTPGFTFHSIHKWIMKLLGKF